MVITGNKKSVCVYDLTVHAVVYYCLIENWKFSWEVICGKCFKYTRDDDGLYSHAYIACGFRAQTQFFLTPPAPPAAVLGKLLQEVDRERAIGCTLVRGQRPKCKCNTRL